MDNLTTLLSRCKCGVFITINEHRDYYQTVEQRIKELYEQRCEPPEISDEIKLKMIATNTIVELHFYPDTPIGFYEIFHYDFNEAVKEALQAVGISPKSAEQAANGNVAGGQGSTNTASQEIANLMVRLCGHIHELSKDQIANNIMQWSRQLRE